MRNQRSICLSALLLIVLVGAVSAQSTEFTYQGSLSNAGAPANGGYDFEFLLFDAVSGGSQLGSTIALNNVAVANGTFTVKLNFGNQFISGTNRFLEIRVRLSGSGGMTTLSPRQSINSAPYAIKSLGAFNAESATTATVALTANNALQLGGVGANQYVVTADPRMTDARPPAPGSGFYIQNAVSVQASSSFNISNTGTANIFNAQTQYDLGGVRVLSRSGTGNFFAGPGTGTANTTGFQNSFFGFRTGIVNATGSNNTFAGANSGAANFGGSSNSFFGANSGQSNTVGGNNSFFGEGAGKFNTNGQSNSFLGRNSGLFNTEGDQNTFIGESAGQSNTTGNNNTVVGFNAGAANSTGSESAIFGVEAGMSASTGENAFFGYRAGASTTGGANSFFGFRAGQANIDGYHETFLGYLAGGAHTTGFNNTMVGYRAGYNDTGGIANVFVGSFAGSSNVSGTGNTYLGYTAGALNTTGSNNTMIGSGARLLNDGYSYATAVGSDSVSGVSNSITLGRNAGQDQVRIPGTLVLLELSVGGGTAICRNAFFIIATCSSSARYKSNIVPFTPGLDLVRRLRPVSFNWKEDGTLDLGFVAEEVNKVEPLLTTYNSKGEVEGVKYDRISVVLINALKEQQGQIETLQKLTRAQESELEKKHALIERQQADIDALKKYICSQNPGAELCQPKQ
jgi:hypothetical protein